MQNSPPELGDVLTWIRARDGDIRVIAAEMAEYSARINSLWATAISRLESDPADAMAKLTDIRILLDHHLRLEREDLLEAVTEGIDRLDSVLMGTDDFPDTD